MVTGVDSGEFIDLPFDFDQHCDCVGFCGLHVAMECPGEGTIYKGLYEGDPSGIVKTAKMHLTCNFRMSLPRRRSGGLHG